MMGAFIDGVMSIFLFIDLDDWPDSPVAMTVETLKTSLWRANGLAATCHEKSLAAD